MTDKEFRKIKETMTEEEWKEYCLNILGKIIESNIEIFKRLKEK